MAPPPSNAVTLPPTTVAPPPPAAPLPVLPLTLRALTLIVVLISVAVIATTDFNGAGFNSISAYRYLFSCGVIGLVYTFLQIGFTVYNASTGNQVAGKGSALVEFYGDNVLSHLLATGAAAGFGLMVDLHRTTGHFYYSFGKANASASLMLFGFVFSAVSSVLSSLSLPKNLPAEVQDRV